ncbi:MAG TPA: pentapeptide repeat-containing protein [Candidatus Limnocylindrales bacterium]|nr:pentapeptide repeat-containing protein [Candidatus Limnocylindrales bacterium]
MSGAQLVQLVGAGETVEMDGVTIVGEVDLRPLEATARIFRCTRCTFEGAIEASNLTFERVVDLSGSRLEGGANFEGAVFRDAFLMRSIGERAATVVEPAVFTLAAFEDRANFDGSQFDSEADFRVTQFVGDASFAGATVAGDARFDSATFEARAQFAGSSIGGDADFTTATFADKSDFRRVAIAGDATFSGAGFEAVDFTQSRFGGVLSFEEASIEGTCSFRAASFEGDVLFGGVALRGPTDFQAASARGEIDFTDTSATDRFDLRGLSTTHPIWLDRVTAPALEMDLDRLENITSVAVQIRVLAMIEAGARERGDIDLANDAAFRRSQLQTDRKAGVDRLVGQAGETVGGYLVQPLVPARAMALLVVIGTLVRAGTRLVPAVSRRRFAWDLAPTPVVVEGEAGPMMGAANDTAADSLNAGDPAAKPAASPTATHNALLAVGKTAATVARAFADTLRAAVRLRPQDIPERRRDDLSAYGAALLAGAEWFAYKLLFALFLIGLANSNPTFKQLVEAVT